jgi:hypothetical protein
MSTEVLNIEQKRQAISRGLDRYLEKTLLEQALVYWENCYGDQPAFVLNRFVNEICTTDELRCQRKDILRHVLGEITEAERHLRLEPKKITEQKHVQNSNFELKLAFERFLNHVLAQVQTADRLDFHKALKDGSKILGLQPHDHPEIQQRIFLDQISVAQYAAFLTMVYQHYCDFYGPTRADQIYARTKERIQSEYLHIDMHQLL